MDVRRIARHFNYFLLVVATLGLTACSANLDMSALFSSARPVPNSLKVEGDPTIVSVAEGGAIAVVFVLEQPASEAVTVHLEMTDVRSDLATTFTNSFPMDFTIAAGQSSKSVVLNSINRPMYTGDKAFTLKATSTEVAGEVTLPIVITDLQSQPVLSIATATQAVSEGAGTATVHVTMTPASAYPVTVAVNAANVNTTAADYSLAATTLTFAPGSTGEDITVNLVDDALIEGTESLNVSLGFVVGLASVDSALDHQTLQIVDNESANLSVAAASANQGSGVTFTIALSAASTLTVAVDYTTQNATAVAGTDYTAATGTLTFAPGEMTKTVTVATAANADICAVTKDFNLHLSNASNATVAIADATGSILDPDRPTLSIADASATEGSAVNFTVSLSNSCPTYAVTFDYATSDGTGVAATDYAAAASSGSITAGQTSTTVSISTIANLLHESDRTFKVTLSNPAQATIATAMATGTIVDDDAIPYVMAVSSALADGTYASGNVDIQVTFSKAMTVTGSPLLTLNTTPSRTAAYFSGSGTSTIVFRYAIQQGDQSADLNYTATTDLALNGGTIKDAGTNSANLTLPDPAGALSLGTAKDIVINSPPAPTIVSLTASADGVYYKGDIINFYVQFSEAVTVTSTPEIPLIVGSTARVASYVSGSGTANLVFKYTIVAADLDSDGITVNSPFTINGTDRIRSTATSVNAILTFTPPDTTAVLADGRTLTLSLGSPITQVDEASGIAQSMVVSLSAAPLVDTVVPVNYYGSAGAADHDFTTTTVTIPKGQTSVTVTYNVLDDLISEVGEFFRIAIDRAVGKSNITLGATDQTKVSIIDNENAGDRWVKVAVGMNRGCGITTTGVLKCWGSNTIGEVGDNTTTPRPTPVVIDAGTTYTDISMSVYFNDGYSHTCGITTAGVLKCWGVNATNQVGDGTTTNRKIPTVVNSGTTYQSVSTRTMGTCAVTTAGVLKCWGNNGSYDVGDGTNVNRTTPTVIDAGVAYTKVSLGNGVHCAITAAGPVKCWGDNGMGQIGDGTTVQRKTPVPITDTTSYSQISAGDRTSCGITTTGVLKCWGMSDSGQLGNGTTNGTQTQVVIDAGTTYVSIEQRQSRACGVTTAGVLKCWGENSSGVAGGALTDVLSPRVIDTSDTYTSVVSGTGYSCAITSAGLLKCWGPGANDGDQTRPRIVDAGVTYSQVSSGTTMSCGLTTSQYVKCWGMPFSYFAALGVGDGTSTPRMLPVVIDTVRKYSQISVGTRHACGIDTTGDLYCWGENEEGEIGDNSLTTRLSPVIVASGTKFSMVSAADEYTCAITTAGVLKCWGVNDYYQLGDNSTTRRRTPVTIDSGTAYASVSGGGAYAMGDGGTCGVTTGGILKCWGYNSTHTPTVLDSGTSYIAVSGNSTISCGLTTTNVMKCWGGNAVGAIGDGTTTGSLVPVVSAGGATYSMVSTNSYSNFGHACGITTAGVLRCWGDNQMSQLGDGTFTDRHSPVTLDAGTTYSYVSAGYTHGCAVTTAGVLKCWGDHNSGQSSAAVSLSPVPFGSF